MCAAMALREPMRSLSDVPLPPVPRAEGVPTRSDLAPRPGLSQPSIPAAPPITDPDAEVSFPPGAFSPDDAIDEQIADLERWAVANEGREHAESLRFWVLRGVAFVSAVLSAVSVQFGYVRASAVLAGV